MALTLVGASLFRPEYMMRTALLTLATIAVATQANLATQSRDSFIGTWKLVSASASTADGRRIDTPYGSSPIGFITYTREGRMMAMVSHGGRKPLSADRISAPALERADAFATFFAYGGRYSVSGDRVSHHVEISSVENWVNTDLVRGFELKGGLLSLRTPPLSVGGTVQTTELVWERVN